MMDASGEVSWTRASFPISSGSHTLSFTYEKDVSIDQNSDCAWIDNITLPHGTQPTEPEGGGEGDVEGSF